MGINMDRLREWVAVDDDKKNAAALEKKAKRKLAEIEPAILEELVQEGAPQIRVELEARDADAEAIEIIGELLPSSPDEIVSELRGAGLLVENRPAITKTIFIGRRVWAKPVATGVDENGEPKATDDDYERACRALERNDFGEYVQERFNIISLSSAMKEEVEHGRIIIPDGADEVIAFDGTIIISETPQLNSRRVAR